jgi:hypothetical protein
MANADKRRYCSLHAFSADQQVAAGVDRYNGSRLDTRLQ